MTYQIDTSFNLQNISGSDYIQSTKFSAKIVHSGLKRFLHYVADNKVSSMSQAEFDSAAKEYEIERKPLLDFLVTQTGLFKVQINNHAFEKLIISGEGRELDLLVDAFNQQPDLKIERHDPSKVITSNNAIILHYAPSLDSAAIKKLYEQSQVDDNYFVTAYLMGDYLAIDNIYSRKSGLPCHHCHIERLKTNSQLVPAGQNKSWLSYYREMMKRDEVALIKRDLPPIYAHYVAYCLYQFTRRLLDPFCPEWHYDQYVQYWHVHLEKMTITKEAASFWPYCGCQSA